MGFNPPEPTLTALGVIHLQIPIRYVIGRIQSAPTGEMFSPGGVLSLPPLPGILIPQATVIGTQRGMDRDGEPVVGTVAILVALLVGAVGRGGLVRFVQSGDQLFAGTGIGHEMIHVILGIIQTHDGRFLAQTAKVIFEDSRNAGKIFNKPNAQSGVLGGDFHPHRFACQQVDASLPTQVGLQRLTHGCYSIFRFFIFQNPVIGNSNSSKNFLSRSIIICC